MRASLLELPELHCIAQTRETVVFRTSSHPGSTSAGMQMWREEGEEDENCNPRAPKEQHHNRRKEDKAHAREEKRFQNASPLDSLLRMRSQTIARGGESR